MKISFFCAIPVNGSNYMKIYQIVDGVITINKRFSVKNLRYGLAGETAERCTSRKQKLLE